MKVTSLALLMASASAVSLDSLKKEPKVANCVGSLPATEAAMKEEMLMFSKNFDKKHFDNAVKIQGALGAKLPRVNTWELYDKAWTWPKIRQYETVQEGMETLEHYEDNLNTNITNSKLLEKFITHAKAI